MVKLDDLPAELIERISRWLLVLSSDQPRVSGKVPDLYQFAMVNKVICHHITHDLALSKWKFADRWIYNHTGLYARTSDIMWTSAFFFPGTEAQAERDCRDIFAPIASRHKLDQEARSCLRKLCYKNGGSLSTLSKIAEFGVNIVDLLFSIRSKALRLDDREIPYACDTLLKRISCARGEEILRSIFSQQSESDLTQFDPEAALNILYAISACYDCSGLTVNVAQLIADAANYVVTATAAGSHEEECRSNGAEVPCTCVHAQIDVFDHIMLALDKQGLTGSQDEDRFDLEDMIALNAHYRKKPVSLLSLCIIFCAVADRFDLPCKVIMLPSGPVINVPCVNAETGEPGYYVPDLEPRDRMKPEGFLLDMIQQDPSLTRQEAFEMIKPMSLGDIASQFAWDILEATSGTPTLINKTVSRRITLTALKVLHLSGQESPFSIMEFARFLTRGDDLGVSTWRKELGKMAQRSGFSQSQSQEAETLWSKFCEAEDEPIDIPARTVPDRAIRFSHGSIVRHKKHNYLCVVYGFDDTCKRPQEWQEKMRVHKLRGGGADQPFYLVMCPTFRWVAEVNLEAVSCSACADRQAAPANGKPAVSPEVEHFMQEIERPTLGTVFRCRKNGGACGFLPSRQQSAIYPASVWPPHANACVTTDDDVSAIDDAIFD